MKSVSNTTIIYSLLALYALLPALCFGLYVLTGKFINPMKFYFLINISLMAILIISLKSFPLSHFYFFLITGLCVCVNIGSTIIYGGRLSYAVNGLRLFSNFYFFIVLAYILYLSFYRTGKMNELLKFCVYIGVFIGAMNILYFIELYLGVFGLMNKIFGYITILNELLVDFIKHPSNSGFLRPYGYFFDTHSQYYFPLGSLFIVLAGKNLKFKFRWLILLLLFTSVLLSGIKSAYAIFFIVFLLIAIKNIRSYKLEISGLVMLLAVCYAWLFEKVNLIVYKIFAHDINILVEHILDNPMKILSHSWQAFCFGGGLNLMSIVYTEVFFVRLLAFIGIIGLSIYLFPLFKIMKFWGDRKNNFIGLVLLCQFFLSLIHYQVYIVGVNILLTAIPFVYLFKYIEKEINSQPPTCTSHSK